jgi:hypothetical protein
VVGWVVRRLDDMAVAVSAFRLGREVRVGGPCEVEALAVAVISLASGLWERDAILATFEGGEGIIIGAKNPRVKKVHSGCPLRR